MTEPRTPENPQDEALVPAAAVPTRTRFAAPPAAAEPLP
ncbi:MAG: hypothetical protein JWN87_2507, partial [Frankiales bacterium]|nr:hypothetical protein [Frankiales bacterium]